MRPYIASRNNGARCPEYQIARSKEAALFWNSKTWKAQVCRVIAREGITIARPFSADRVNF